MKEMGNEPHEFTDFLPFVGPVPERLSSVIGRK